MIIVSATFPSDGLDSAHIWRLDAYDPLILPIRVLRWPKRRSRPKNGCVRRSQLHVQLRSTVELRPPLHRKRESDNWLAEVAKKEKRRRLMVIAT